MARVLVVDDHPDILALTVAVLELAGHEVDTAQNGREGVDKAVDREPDAIVLDIMMPVMDGLEALKILQTETTSRIPVLLMSAKTDISDIEAGLAAGAVGYLTKPFNPNALLGELSRALSSSSPPTGGRQSAER